jgi:tRNA (guanine-N7-)-methyltransferase
MLEFQRYDIVEKMKVLILLFEMGKNKLHRYHELMSLDRVFQPARIPPDTFYEKRGRWNQDVFGNSNPIVVELGCGKGEYTVNLAQKYPHKNFIGIDIKGARIWRGAKTVNDEHINNAAFLRIQIEQLNAFFAEGEISEIWITFPDPQPPRSREKKRLTSASFLSVYRDLLAPNGKIHLKTDSLLLHQYTLGIVNEKGLAIHESSTDLYSDVDDDDVVAIKTTYEKRFLAEGKTICYLCFGFYQ